MQIALVYIAIGSRTLLAANYCFDIFTSEYEAQYRFKGVRSIGTCLRFNTKMGYIFGNTHLHSTKDIDIKQMYMRLEHMQIRM